MINRLLFKLPLLLFPFFVLCQETTPRFKFRNVKEGISKVGIYKIDQDRKGFIWLATNGAGLYRFDGFEYKSYKHSMKDSTSLSSNTILTTYVDEFNRLWIGTEDGLNLYDDNFDNFQRIKINKDLEDAHTNISVSSIIEGQPGELFIGSLNYGLFKLNLENFSIEPITSSTDISRQPLKVNELAKDTSGTLYAATNRGLRRYNFSQNTLTKLPFTEKQQYLNLPLESLMIDSNNTLWAGSESHGLFRLPLDTNKESIKIFDYSDNKHLYLHDLKDGSILCGIENSGLYHINYNGDLIYHYTDNDNVENSLLSNSVWSVLLDKNNRIWVGYYNKGLSVHDHLHDKFSELEHLKHNSNSLTHGSVTAMVEDSNNNLWIATDGGGIDILDSSKHTYTHINPDNESAYSGLSSYYIESLFIDSNDNLWASSWDNGIFLLKKGTKSFINFNQTTTNRNLSTNTITTISEDHNKNIWFGSNSKGLYSYNLNKQKFTHHNYDTFEDNNLINSEIKKIVIDRNNTMWIGSTTEGLFKIDISNLEQGAIVTAMGNELPREFIAHNGSDNILSLYEGHDNLWIGTRGAGLCKYNFTSKSFTWYNTSNGLNEENINGIIQDDEHTLWLAGNLGITKFELKSNSFTTYSKDDGLLSNDFNLNATYKDKFGNLYFGNFLGVDYFNPRDVRLNKDLPKLYFSDFKLFNKSVAYAKDSPLEKVISKTEHLELNNNQSVFTFEYSSINYTRPEKNEYAYYLEGYEEDWNFVGSKRNATYTNLDAGIYTFKVKASNNDGIWNETPLSLSIKVLPPWWKTYWALAFYVLLFTASLYAFFKIIHSRFRDKQLVEAERNKRLLENDLNEKKLQFFTNISHEFRTPLSLIIGPLEDIIKNYNSKLPEIVVHKHKTIHRNTQRLFRLINELLDFRKLDSKTIQLKVIELNLVDFSKNIISHFKEEIHTKHIEFIFDTDSPHTTIWADESMLDKILFNILSNAFKVTPDNGTICVEIAANKVLKRTTSTEINLSNKAVSISISDTGPGLKKDQIDKIFDRFYTVDNLHNAYYGGTGIGLEVVKNFVELHRGELTVSSEVGKGTTFEVIFPANKSFFKKEEILNKTIDTIVIKDKPILAEINNRKETEPANGNESPKTHTLLIVEDNTELRNYLKTELKEHFKIIVAKNGKEGLEKANSKIIDIILTDVVMPEMDGFTFCKHIKSDIKTSHIPLLMLTAKTQTKNRIIGIQNGADAYMVKPFDIELLKLRLSQLITSRQLIFNKYFSVISDSNNKDVTSLDKKFLEKVLAHINNEIANPDLNVEYLASELSLSRSQFYRKTKAITNQNPNELIRNIRLMRAKTIIENGNSNISEVAFKVGFSSSSYFSKCFKNQFGILPKQAIRKEEF